jgi:hypothetical protein
MRIFGKSVRLIEDPCNDLYGGAWIVTGNKVAESFESRSAGMVQRTFTTKVRIFS